MNGTELELHARHERDLSTLKALERSLVEIGLRPTLTVPAETLLPGEPARPRGPVRCRVRVQLAGDTKEPELPAELRVGIVDRLWPPAADAPPSDVLARANLILAPGPAHQAALARRYAGEVVGVGLAWLDPLFRDAEARRRAAREALGVPEDARLALYAPADPPGSWALEVLGEEVVRVARAGWLALIVLSEESDGAPSAPRELALRVPGLALTSPAATDRALAAADVILAEGGPLLHEALVLGRGVVRLGGREVCEAGSVLAELPAVLRAEDLPAALESVLPGGSEAARLASIAAHCREELLSFPGRAAEQMAREIQRHCFAPAERVEAQRTPAAPVTENVPPSDCGGPESLEQIEARASFGDIDGALAALRTHLAAQPSAHAYCLQASIHRRQGELAPALEALECAEPLAREDLGRVLCERARAHVDGGELGAARGLFEEATGISPRSADPWVGLGSLALHAQHAPEAERCFREAIDREYSARVWTGLGLALVGQQRGKEAIPCFESALDLEGESVTALHGLVQAAFQSGELAAAECRLREYLELHSGNLDLLFTLAGLRVQLGDAAGAREAIERIELFRSDYPGLDALREKLESVP
ncbi:MAG: tetratricopeptide repeat protein [Myxococcota bacterium]